MLTLPTAASPSSTSFTLLLGFGPLALESVIGVVEGSFAELRARRLLPRLTSDTLMLGEYARFRGGIGSLEGLIERWFWYLECV